MTENVSWGYEEAERNLSILMNFCSQHGAPEEKAFAEKIYERWPHLRAVEIKELNPARQGSTPTNKR
jgi:hypothetical protein